MTVPAQTAPAPLVFAPARPLPQASVKDVVFEMRRQPDGSLVLPVFFSLPLLIEALGRYQPWVCVPLQKVHDAAARHGLVRLVTNPGLDESAWRWGQAELLMFGEYIDEVEEAER